jgi:hypothetical protein
VADNNLEGSFQRAIERLSELVQQRDRCLSQLETLATLPLSISPRSGHVAEFDLAGARELLDSLEQQTGLIEQAIQAVNRLARESGRVGVVWIKMPRGKNEQG